MSGQLTMHPSVRRILDFPRIGQRTPEWYLYRNNRVTASEVSTILAQGKGYQRIFEQKVGMRDSGMSSEYMQIGTDNEEVVAELYRKKYPHETVYHDLSIIPHKTLDFVAASLDAMTASGINVEIKTMFKDKFVKVSKMYFCQVQLQMECSDLDKTHLVQHYIRMEGQPIVVHEIMRDKQWFADNVHIFKKFIKEVREFFPFDIECFKSQLVNRVPTPYVHESFSFDVDDFDTQILEQKVRETFSFDIQEFNSQVDYIEQWEDVKMHCFEESAYPQDMCF